MMRLLPIQKKKMEAMKIKSVLLKKRFRFKILKKGKGVSRNKKR